MKTFFLVPEKSGEAFIAPVDKDRCLMDTAVADTSGLAREIEQQLAILRPPKDFNQRLIDYYRLLRRWLADHPENVMTRSFSVAPLSTTRRLLLWRDALKTACWDFSDPDTTSRLGALAGVESYGITEGLPDRLLFLIRKIEESPPGAFRDFRIVIPVERLLLRPILGRLLDALESRGATIAENEFPAEQAPNLKAVADLLLSDATEGKITLDPTEGSFRILEFDTAYDLSEYAVVCRGAIAADVTIDPEAKATDNRLKGLHLPTSGSKVVSRSRILNLLPLALSLYDDSLDINRLVEWFSAPLHPLPESFRYSLAETMASTGGFLNDNCRNVVAQSDLDDSLLRLYVPFLSAGSTRAPSAAQAARATLENLATWARARVSRLPEDEEARAEALQLGALADSIDILLMLSAGDKGDFDLRLAREWVREIPAEITIPQHPACVGAAFSVASPADMVSPTPSVAWIGMHATIPEGFDCDFLLPGERESIEAHASFWSRGRESRYRYLCSIMPFRYATQRLTLAVADKRGGEKLVPHPLLTRLRLQIENFKAFVEKPTPIHMRTVPLPRVENTARKGEYHFENPFNARLPYRMSATSLEQIVNFPFDFLFERVLRIGNAGMASLPSMNIMRGNMAHQVVAGLFSPPAPGEAAAPSIIRGRVAADYDRLLSEAIDECGALFRLPENILELNSFDYSLRHCIAALLDIIEQNGLAVTGCENSYEKCIDLHALGSLAADMPDLMGKIDMTLKTEDGRPVIFDLKWTSRPDFYRKALEANRSVQLAVYARVLPQPDAATGYFVMPDGVLFTTSPFTGPGVERIRPESSYDLMPQLVNSFRYRCAQLLAGTVEEGEDSPLSDLSYESDRVAKNLFPLPEDEGGVKKEYRFSAYRAFKGK